MSPTQENCQRSTSAGQFNPGVIHVFICADRLRAKSASGSAVLQQVRVWHSNKLDCAFLAEFGERSSWTSVKTNAAFYEAERCAGRAGVKRVQSPKP